MFVLTRLTDTVKLLPSTEYTPSALTLWLNTKYSNRVQHKIGLCIAVYDILSVGDGALKYGDGCVYIKSTAGSSLFC
jgi:DNA-directed RNA polymerase III subunit RPC8